MPNAREQDRAVARLWHESPGPTMSAGALCAGGDEGNRTPNPRLAKAVLCQLSYVPVVEQITRSRGRARSAGGGLVPQVGVRAGGADLGEDQGAGGESDGDGE